MLSVVIGWWWSRVIVHLIFVTIRVPVLLLWIVTTILRSWHELGSLPSREKESVITQRRQAFLYSALRMIIASDKPEKEYQYDCANDSPLDGDSCVRVAPPIV